jgi:hypothetical protein
VALMLLLQLVTMTTACLRDSSASRCVRAAGRRPVIAAQLASNALSNIAARGGPVGAALQYRMFVRAGHDGPSTVSALTGTAGVVAVF